jgi:hypothetical protein
MGSHSGSSSGSSYETGPGPGAAYGGPAPEVSAQ